MAANDLGGSAVGALAGAGARPDALPHAFLEGGEEAAALNGAPRQIWCTAGAGAARAPSSEPGCPQRSLPTVLVLPDAATRGPSDIRAAGRCGLTGCLATACAVLTTGCLATPFAPAGCLPRFLLAAASSAAAMARLALALSLGPPTSAPALPCTTCSTSVILPRHCAEHTWHAVVPLTSPDQCGPRRHRKAWCGCSGSVSQRPGKYTQHSNGIRRYPSSAPSRSE